MNPGGSWDAYWQLTGGLGTTNSATHNTTHFEATFGAHAVLFGFDVDVVTINTVADTSTGSGTFSTYQGSAVSPDAVGCVHMYLFGAEIFSDGGSGPSVDFNFSASETWIKTCLRSISPSSASGWEQLLPWKSTRPVNFPLLVLKLQSCQAHPWERT
jgi:hypothetical protein